MPRRCSICIHPQRDAIDQALVLGEVFREVAAKFRVSEDAISRHNDNHLPSALVQSQMADDISRADSLLGQLRMLHGRTLAILTRAEETGELRTAIAAISQARANLELLARLLGELQEQSASVNVLVASPDWLQLRSTILNALTDYPDARQAVTEALRRGLNASQ